MPNSAPTRPRRPRDLSLLAHAIVDEATAEREPPAAPAATPEPATDAPEPTPTDDGKNPAAVALGRLGGLKGGKARAAKLTAEERREIAKRAAAARWAASRSGGEAR